MDHMLPLTPSQLDRYVEAAGESTDVEAKGPLTWDGGPISAALAKDLAAFANSRDGGVIVVGKSEGPSGRLEQTGLTSEQCRSFETTKVCQWINQRFDPPIRAVCHSHEYRGRLFTIIAIAEFYESPSICTKDYQDSNNTKRFLLKAGALYVRNSNAESAVLSTSRELRDLIALATSKRRDEILSLITSIVKGRPPQESNRDAEKFDTELQQIINGLDDTGIRSQRSNGAWEMSFRPTRYVADRWKSAEQLREIVENSSVKLYDTFPSSRTGTHRREWGIANSAYGAVWSFAHSGFFLYVEEYLENSRQYEPNWTPPPLSLAAGQWVDFSSSLRRIFEMTAFAARLCQGLDVNDGVEFTIRATQLRGRRLVESSFSVHWDPSDQCRANEFQHTRIVNVPELIADWRVIAAESMIKFVEYFPLARGSGLARHTALDWVSRLESRAV
jgi:hypothetical protein